MRYYKLLLLLLPLLLWSACSDEEDKTPPDEEYRGTYLVRNLGEVIDLAKQDSVTFKIRAGAYFDLHFYELNGPNDDVHFCDATGNLLDFGTGKVGFDPTHVFSNNCDTLRIPRGDFAADFKNHGDTVYIYKEVTVVKGLETIDSLYRLVLLQVK